MPTDYRFHILEILYNESPNLVNLRPLFTNYIEEQGITRQHLVQILRSLKNDEFIWHSDISSLSVKHAGEFNDTVGINARIEYKGMDEYRRLKKEYSPDPLPNAIYVAGSFQGHISQGNTGPVHQSTNAENPESIELARKGLKVNKNVLIWAIIAAAIALLGILLSVVTSK